VKIVRLSSNVLQFCDYCDYVQADVREWDWLASMATHYTQEHGFEILHIGTESSQDDKGTFHYTVAYLGLSRSQRG
jgi:hypothetical protein